MIRHILPTAVGLILTFLCIGIIPRRPFFALGLSDLAVGVIVMGLALAVGYLAATWVERRLNRR